MSTHVQGKKIADLMLYSLSTCYWCNQLKQMLNDAGIDYTYIDVDRLAGREKEDVQAKMDVHNPSGSFPCLVIDDTLVIQGFKKKKVKELLGI